jgi:hypothetical protein
MLVTEKRNVLPLEIAPIDPSPPEKKCFITVWVSCRGPPIADGAKSQRSSFRCFTWRRGQSDDPLGNDQHDDDSAAQQIAQPPSTDPLPDRMNVILPNIQNGLACLQVVYTQSHTHKHKRLLPLLSILERWIFNFIIILILLCLYHRWNDVICRYTISNVLIVPREIEKCNPVHSTCCTQFVCIKYKTTNPNIIRER